MSYKIIMSQKLTVITEKLLVSLNCFNFM
jgi:hypothetical protein